MKALQVWFLLRPLLGLQVLSSPLAASSHRGHSAQAHFCCLLLCSHKQRSYWVRTACPGPPRRPPPRTPPYPLPPDSLICCSLGSGSALAFPLGTLVMLMLLTWGPQLEEVTSEAWMRRSNVHSWPRFWLE